MIFLIVMASIVFIILFILIGENGYNKYCAKANECSGSVRCRCKSKSEISCFEMKKKNILKRLFCKHDWVVDEECIVHYPDYEPHKVGVIGHCEICGKRIRTLYLPDEYINKFGRDEYEKVKRGEKLL